MAERNDFYVLIFIVVLILIVIGILTVPFLKNLFLISQEKSTTLTYRGFIFTKVENLWLTQWERDKQLYNLAFHFNPKEVENVPVSGTLYDNFSESGIVYITFDPDVGPPLGYVALTAGELSLNLARGLNYELVAACTRNETEGCKDRPIVTCEDLDKSIIYIKVANETGVDFLGNCIIVKGSESELVKSADNLLFRWYRIIV